MRPTPLSLAEKCKNVGISMIAAHSPEARGRSERIFGTWQGRLPNELALHKITDISAANQFIRDTFLAEMNQRFTVIAAEQGNAFVPLPDTWLDGILCLKVARAVGNDNCVKYRGKLLRIPKTTGRSHYAEASVWVHEYQDQRTSVYHGPRLL